MVKGKAHVFLLYFHLSPFLQDNGFMEFLFLFYIYIYIELWLNLNLVKLINLIKKNLGQILSFPC